MDERENFDSNIENAIEFLKNADTATCTLTQGRFISRIKELAKKYPEECQVVHENKDGSIVAHFPVKWIHISRIERTLTEEQRKASRERLLEYNKTRCNNE